CSNRISASLSWIATAGELMGFLCATCQRLPAGVYLWLRRLGRFSALRQGLTGGSYPGAQSAALCTCQARSHNSTRLLAGPQAKAPHQKLESSTLPKPHLRSIRKAFRDARPPESGFVCRRERFSSRPNACANRARKQSFPEG